MKVLEFLTSPTMVAIVQMIGSLATAGALWVTYSSLKELRRQTELANNPYLKIRFKYYENDKYAAECMDTPPVKCDFKFNPHEVWQRFIVQNFRQRDRSGLKDSILVVELSNRGKSEITHIELELLLNVSMFEENNLHLTVEAQSYNFVLDEQFDLGEGTRALLEVTNVKYLPIYKCSIKNIKYKDVRGSVYTKFDGSDSTSKINELLKPQLEGQNDNLIDMDEQFTHITDAIYEEEIQPSDDGIPF